MFPANSIFSVIIPTHNRADQVMRAIKSVLWQSYLPLEIIVIDDGSEDQTAAAVKKMAGSGVRYIYQQHSGVSAARNHGAKLSHAPIIAFLDSDDEWHPGKLKSQFDFSQKNPQINVWQTKECWIRSGKSVRMHRDFEKQDGLFFEKSLKRCMITPSSVCIRKTFFEALGGFDEKLPACEDYDLWLRLGDKEPVGLINEELLIRYAGHPNQLSERFAAMDRFRIYALLKLMPALHTLTEMNQFHWKNILQKKSHILRLGYIKRNPQDEFSDYLYRIAQGHLPNQKSADYICEQLLHAERFN